MTEILTLSTGDKDEIGELAQKLYNEDGHQGSIYRKANLETLGYYENKAIEIIGGGN